MANNISADVQERIKADAETYAGVMFWVNQNPKGEEQLFYEYISSTSYSAGATAQAERMQVEIEILNADFKRVQKAAIDYANRKDEVVKQRDQLAERAQAILDALDQFISFHESGLLPVKHVYENAVAVRQQWKEGKDKEPVKDNI